MPDVAKTFDLISALLEIAEHGSKVGTKLNLIFALLESSKVGKMLSLIFVCRE